MVRHPPPETAAGDGLHGPGGGAARPSRPAVLGALLLVFVSAAVGFLLVDVWVGIGTRDETARPVEGQNVPFPPLGWTNAPNHEKDGMTTDALGLRGPARPVRADAAQILFLGDSRIFGTGVADEHIWSTHLQRLLDEAGVPAQVRNGGVKGYSGVQSARRGVLLLDDVDPALVVIFLSPCWSLVDNSAAGEWVAVGNRFTPASVVAGWPELLHPLKVSVHELMLHSNLYLRRQAVERGRGIAPRLADFTLTRSPPEDAQPLVDRLRRALVELRKAAEARGATVVALLLPEDFQVNPAAWQAYLRDKAATGAPPPDTGAREPLRALAELVESAGIEARTMWDDVLAIMRVPDSYLKAHWTESGHAAAAPLVLARLQERGLLQRASSGRGP